MKKYFLITLISLLLAPGFKAQENNNEVLITIDSTKITKSEFMRIYQKNNSDSVIDQKSLEEYLNLFINFKLKVLEAERLGLDTLKSFVVELQGYRRQLEKPYLTNQSIDESLIKEAYDRMTKDVKASHILIRVSENASPEDTLAAYNKIMKIRNRIIKGESFEKVARETSEDKSVKNNSGNLGYFTAFQMVYPFETAAYNTKVGDISMPVRTKFGYHIIKVFDTRDAVGKVKVAHIMKSIPPESSPEVAKQAYDTIMVVYNQLKEGADFAKLAKKYSDDKSSAARGGELRMFGTGKMVPTFESAAFSLNKVGDISKPVKTAYGWHILKLLQKSEIKSFDEMKSMIKTKVTRDSRSEKSKSAVIAELKKEYNFKYDKKKLAQFYTVVDNSIFSGNWSAENAKNLNSDFVWYADKSLNQQWFANYLEAKRAPDKTVIPVKEYVDKMFEYFVEKYLIQYEKTQLEDKYPEFKYLMQEYHDGILLFDLTDKMVWTKAVEDTIGLEEFYNKNKNKYMWGERFNGRIYTCSNEKVFKKVNKFLNKESNQSLSIDEILAKFNKKGEKNLEIEENIYSKGDNKIIDHYVWNIGTYNENNSEAKIVIKGEKLAPSPKKLDEAKGLITADYQTYLEDEWVKNLRKKYKITVNEELLKTIK
ncbi:MAG: hypothetical protein GXO79_15035 [Chlorobi bacterium]|nr:hypothetical protein [Chlorobiota bacterium]